MKTAIITGITGQDAAYLAEPLLDNALDEHHPFIQAGDNFQFTAGLIRRRDVFEEGWHISETKGVALPFQGEMTYCLDNSVTCIDLEVDSPTIPKETDIGELSWRGHTDTATKIFTGKIVR